MSADGTFMTRLLGVRVPGAINDGRKPDTRQLVGAGWLTAEAPRRWEHDYVRERASRLPPRQEAYVFQNHEN